MTKYKQAKPVFKTSVQAKALEPVESKFKWLGISFKLSAALLVIIYLYGYGAVVGYAAALGIPQTALYSSPFDLLVISTETFLYQTLDFVKTGDAYFHIWSFFKSIFPGIFIFALGFWFISYILNLLDKKKKINQKPFTASKRIKNFFFPESSALENESDSGTAIRSIWQTIAASIIVIISQLFIFIAILFLFILILVVPILGYIATTNHARQDIILPKLCDPILSRVQLIESLEKQKAPKIAGIKIEPVVPTANCIKVTYSDTKGSKTIAGRSVLAGSDYILVYEVIGKTTRIPLKTAVIETADDAVLKEVELQNEKLLAVKAQ